MQVSIADSKSIFIPFTLNIEVHTREEAEALFARFNIPAHAVDDYLRRNEDGTGCRATGVSTLHIFKAIRARITNKVRVVYD